MQILGVVLIVGVIIILFAYFKWSKQEVVTEKSKEGEQKITVIVSGAYAPNIIHAKLGKPLTVIFDRREDTACSKKVLFPDFNIVKELLDFGKTEVKFIPNKTGNFDFTCEMGMYQGKLIVEE